MIGREPTVGSQLISRSYPSCRSAPQNLRPRLMVRYPHVSVRNRIAQRYYLYCFDSTNTIITLSPFYYVAAFVFARKRSWDAASLTVTATTGAPARVQGRVGCLNLQDYSPTFPRWIERNVYFAPSRAQRLSRIRYSADPEPYVSLGDYGVQISLTFLGISRSSMFRNSG